MDKGSCIFIFIVALIIAIALAITAVFYPTAARYIGVALVLSIFLVPGSIMLYREGFKSGESFRWAVIRTFVFFAVWTVLNVVSPRQHYSSFAKQLSQSISLSLGALVLLIPIITGRLISLCRHRAAQFPMNH